MKLKQPEKQNETSDPVLERTIEKEKQMQMRRQTYMEQLDMPKIENVNQNEMITCKSKNKKKVQTKTTKKKG